MRRVLPLVGLLSCSLACSVDFFVSHEAQSAAGTRVPVDVQVAFDARYPPAPSTPSSRDAQGIACVSLPEAWPAPAATYAFGDGVQQDGTPEPELSALAEQSQPRAGSAWHCLSAVHRVVSGESAARATFQLDVPAGTSGRYALGYLVTSRDYVPADADAGTPEGYQGVSFSTPVVKELRVGEAPRSTFSHWYAPASRPAVRNGDNSDLGVVAAGDGAFLAAGPYGVLTSTDASTWTLQPAAPVTFSRLVRGAGQFVGFSNGSSALYSSPDGASWTNTYTDAQNRALFNATFAAGQFVVVGAQGLVLTSPDGLTWTPTTVPVTANLLAVAELNGTFVVTGSGTDPVTNSPHGVVLRSSDALTWTEVPAAPAGLITQLVAGHGRLVGILDTSAAPLVSEDVGLTWASGVGSPNAGGATLTFAADRFVLASPGTQPLYVSSAGYGWTPVEMGTNAALPAIAASAEKVVAVGSDGFVAVADVRAMAAPEFLTHELPGATVSVNYAQPVLGEYGTGLTTLALKDGALPEGVAFEREALVGAPTAPGTYALTFQLTDADGRHTEQALSLRVAAFPSLTPSTLPLAVVGREYQAQLQALGGTAPVSVGVNYPEDSWLTVSEASSVLSLGGVPQAVGTFELQASVRDANGAQALAAYTIEAVEAPVVETAGELPVAVIGRPYTATLSASGGTGPYTWSFEGAAPVPGLQLAADTGVLSGVPTQAGTFALDSVMVTDARGVSTHAALELVVLSVPSIQTPDSLVAILGAPYTGSFTVSGGTAPFTWSFAGSLPAGLTLTQQDGAFVLEGSASQAGDVTLEGLTVTDANGLSSTMDAVVHVRAKLQLGAPASLPAAQQGSAYAAVHFTATGGVTPRTWSSTGTLPAGMQLREEAGDFVLSGTPSQTGTFTVKVNAKDGEQTASLERTLTVSAAPVTPTTPSTPTTPTTPAKGGGCSQTGDTQGGLQVLGLGALALMIRRRRRTA
ncbi:hypothetical protein FGE12_05625 [Aggregicoccus sp. 17bor-14]|uniref:putative Ig domain-containing protein n=1 Tax=Myxococcaceae TaxID=31 RepID=UPI00129CEBFC|nr:MULTISPECIES: putative Ig domain-containing protein [Myxococcaceae]MBF5041862.1 putative Ig domain-containing protein [Simulacricoccus sp. 17bor-14]MRI87643.1 hypothetical protein [Aggregicoccus sp. 17bor-14]